jgi:hypothetical protein
MLETPDFSCATTLRLKGPQYFGTPEKAEGMPGRLQAQARW